MFLAGLNLGCLVMVTLPMAMIMLGMAFLINPTLGCITTILLIGSIVKIVQNEIKHQNRNPFE